MISTLHGRLALIVYPDKGLTVTPGGRTAICTVRGEALGQRVNCDITLDLHTGELLIMSPDNFVGAFRLGDLVTAHVTRQVAEAQRAMEMGGRHGNAQAH